MSFYNNVIKTKKAIERTITSSNPTDWLNNERTVHKYYQDLLKRNKKEKSRLMTVKQVDGGEWRLKIQCGKFAHPLFVDDDTTYELAHFDSKQEALDHFDEWVKDLKRGVPGIVQAVEKGYNQWRESNDKNTIKLDEYYKLQEQS